MSYEKESKVLSKGMNGVALLTPDEKSVIVTKKWNDYYGKYSDWEIFQHLASRRALAQVLGQPDFEVISVKNGYYIIKSAYMQCMIEKNFKNLGHAIRQINQHSLKFPNLLSALDLKLFYRPLLDNATVSFIKRYMAKAMDFKQSDSLRFLHGDPNIDNWFPGNGFIDWDYACVGPGEYDLACAISVRMIDIFSFDGKLRNLQDLADLKAGYGELNEERLNFMLKYRLLERYTALKHKLNPKVKARVEEYLRAETF